jgi:glycerol-3-phosphate cytidylyltransferase-like family protein
MITSAIRVSSLRLAHHSHYLQRQRATVLESIRMVHNVASDASSPPSVTFMKDTKKGVNFLLNDNIEKSKMRLGVLFLNLGGPATLNVRD